MSIQAPMSVSREPGDSGPLVFDWPSANAQGVAAQFTYKDGEVEIKGHVSRGCSGLSITRVTVTAPLPGGVTHNMLRDAPLSAILRQARAESMPAIQPMQIPRTSGRTPMTDELLRAVALAFIEETGPGKDRRAIQRMAKRFERPEGTVRAWIARARKDGWLAPGSKVRIGAEAGRRLASTESRP